MLNIRFRWRRSFTHKELTEILAKGLEGTRAVSFQGLDDLTGLEKNRSAVYGQAWFRITVALSPPSSATAISRSPSPSRSAKTADSGLLRVARCSGVLNDPVPSLRSTETLSLSWLAIASLWSNLCSSHPGRSSRVHMAATLCSQSGNFLETSPRVSCL